MALIQQVRPEVLRRMVVEMHEETPPQPEGDVNVSLERLRGDIRTGFAEAKLYTSELVRGATDEVRKDITPVRDDVSEIKGRVSSLYWFIGIAVGLLAVVVAVVNVGSVDISTVLQSVYVKFHHICRTMVEDCRLSKGMSRRIRRSRRQLQTIHRSCSMDHSLRWTVEAASSRVR